MNRQELVDILSAGISPEPYDVYIEIATTCKYGFSDNNMHRHIIRFGRVLSECEFTADEALQLFNSAYSKRKRDSTNAEQTFIMAFGSESEHREAVDLETTLIPYKTRSFTLLDNAYVKNNTTGTVETQPPLADPLTPKSKLQMFLGHDAGVRKLKEEVIRPTYILLDFDAGKPTYDEAIEFYSRVPYRVALQKSISYEKGFAEKFHAFVPVLTTPIELGTWTESSKEIIKNYMMDDWKLDSTTYSNAQNAGFKISSHAFWSNHKDKMLEIKHIF